MDLDYLKKLLSPSKADPIGLDAMLRGIRQLKTRLADERQAVETERSRLRDAALDDPSAELGTKALLAKEKRVEALEAALEIALKEGAQALGSRMGAIEKMIDTLNAERADLARKRDLEYLRALREFIEKTGGALEDMPRLQHGGRIRIPGTWVLTHAEVEEALGTLPKSGKPAPTKVSGELDKLRAELERLTTLRYLGPRPGLETLLGT